MKTTLHLLKEFFKNPKTTGAIANSSNDLAELITSQANLQTASCIVELGTGTGVFTKKILFKKSEDCQFIALELNSTLAQQTQKQFPNEAIYNDNATNTKNYLIKHNVQHCDTIISGLPWASFNKELQEEIMDSINDSLSPTGEFLTFTYLHSTALPSGKRLRKLLNKNFSTVQKTKIIWNNLPPAIVYHCKKDNISIKSDQ
jgi:phosphatidylethanolamine/phosphatidyl-N-methylethanolamine N-methyltransferase